MRNVSVLSVSRGYVCVGIVSVCVGIVSVCVWVYGPCVWHIASVHRTCIMCVECVLVHACVLSLLSTRWSQTNDSQIQEWYQYDKSGTNMTRVVPV